jgi:hypothetical protein
VSDDEVGAGAGDDDAEYGYEERWCGNAHGTTFGGRATAGNPTFVYRSV